MVIKEVNKLRQQFDKEQSWGLETQIDLHECDSRVIRSKSEITRFVEELCDKIDMKRFGDCQVVHFGEDERVAGYSMTQLIETSLISAHFANQTNATYLNVFSCKFFDPYKTADFAKEFFKAKNYTLNIALRK